MKLGDEATKAGALLDAAGLQPSINGTRIALTAGQLNVTDGNDVPEERRPLAASHPLTERLQGLLIRAVYVRGALRRHLEAAWDTDAAGIMVAPATALTGRV